METMEPILAAHPFCKGLESRYLKLIVDMRLPGDVSPRGNSCAGITKKPGSFT